MKKHILVRVLAVLFLSILLSSFCLTAVSGVSIDGEELVTQETEMTKKERLEKTVYFQNLNYAAACDGVLTVINPSDKSITPYFDGDKFYIPLRFTLEYFGVGVSWEHETKTVVMTAGEKEYRLSTKDSVMSYGEKTKELSNPCNIIKGTTFVSFDDISEIIGCRTFFFDSYKSCVITAGEEWNEERQAEKDALRAMEFAVSPFFKMFV